ncbi:multidrug resistance-associated ABC transporter [Pholiota conissans]|uniref:Multidrug resistance-associated ABC transporter n=1 Tax=Pholiota conissans TaxID=109636 RepID=A0A9P5Z258_9AGAR|nr:multidrug resistance-associated ABC transporter [Pholiota conissans]
MGISGLISCHDCIKRRIATAKQPRVLSNLPHPDIEKKDSLYTFIQFKKDMSRFELAIAVVLVLSSAASFCATFVARKTEGNVQLPVFTEPGVEYDAFDVADVEDMVDGYPVDTEGFWTRMRWRKIFVAFLLSIGVIITTVVFGWSIASSDSGIAAQLLQSIFSLYILLLASSSIQQDAPGAHRESTLHLMALLTVGVALLGCYAVIPQDSSIAASVYALLGIYTIACGTCFTTPLEPQLHYPPSSIYSEKTVKAITNADEVNVCGMVDSSPLGMLFFSYTTKVIQLGNTASSIDIGDLPILPANMRASYNYAKMTQAMRSISSRFFLWTIPDDRGLLLGWKLIRLNHVIFSALFVLSAILPFTAYIPPLFLRLLVSFLEADPKREDISWGWVYVIGLFFGHAFAYLMNGQVYSLSSTIVQTRLKIQLGSILYAKTLVRKAPTFSTPSSEEISQKPDEDAEFASKAQILILMTSDADRAAGTAGLGFALISSCVETVVAFVFLYSLLGISSLVGIGITCLFLPLNRYSGRVVMGAQENLMKTRDERISLTNEILDGIRMLKFMGWERNFENRVHALRDRELKWQRISFSIEVLWNALWNGIPIFVTLASFWHFAVVRNQPLTPSIAFTTILVFAEMRYALTSLPEIFIRLVQGLVSLRRVEKYLKGAQVERVPSLKEQYKTIALQSCTLTWPSTTPLTSAYQFRLMNVSLDFPQGELTLICGKLGSGKTLLLLALLGEAEVLSGKVCCPRTPLNSLLASPRLKIRKEDWIIDGACAYVSQTAWQRNASIRDNILFNLPYDEHRYRQTLEACALIHDLEILEDGDLSEIGEQGINLSGGQKARVCLARAIYSRASILILDDVLSAVDVHTAHHVYHECLKGKLVVGRTVILVSHLIQLCTPGASYIVALDNGNVRFEGSKEGFHQSGVYKSLINSSLAEGDATNEHPSSEERTHVMENRPQISTNSTVAIDASAASSETKMPRKFVQEEKRAQGRVERAIWELYLHACGNGWYWSAFVIVFVSAAVVPVLDRGWLGYWSDSALLGTDRSPSYYISIYSSITLTGLIVSTARWFILYAGSIHASNTLYKQMLESVLFAPLRFHESTSRGSLLNRFGKDFEGIDSKLSNEFGQTIIGALSVVVTFSTLAFVGGLLYIASALLLGILYWNVAKLYGPASRDTRRLESATRSPIYSLYAETISGVITLRAFGASAQFLKDMLRAVDTNTNPFYWMWGVNRWLNVRFNMLSAFLVGVTGFVCLVSPNVSASLTGFALTFVMTINQDLLGMVRRFIGLEQGLVALERIQEYIKIEREPAEFVEPRPPASWPSEGVVKCEHLAVRYAPHLPNVLKDISFEVHAGEKIGIIGRTGSGKSTLALSFFRFVEAAEGRIMVDGIDISRIGLTDLRTRLTIIPQDPTLLSGTLRATLDVFGEYEDAEIYEALRRVHLIPSDTSIEHGESTGNRNIFQDLDSKVSETGDNMSSGEKQLLCMARAILKHSKVLIMDEATASVDYVTDELIGKAVRDQFATSTILTIAHRLRTVIDYDRAGLVMVLEQGSIVEFDSPVTLLRNPESKFYTLCKASGKEEFSLLKKLAGI